MNEQTILTLVNFSNEILEKIKICRDRLNTYFESIMNPDSSIDDHVGDSLNRYKRMVDLVETICEDSEGLIEGTIFDHSKVEENFNKLIFNYTESELSRHDLFGKVIRHHLHFLPRDRDSCEMQDILLEYLEKLRDMKNISNGFSDKNEFDLLKSKLRFKSATPDNYCIAKETKDGSLQLVIYDWKVSVDTQTEIKTINKYYDNVLETFKDITVCGQPFLERCPIYICIVILKPLGVMPVITTIMRVNGPFEKNVGRFFNSRKDTAAQGKICNIKQISQCKVGNGSILREYFNSTQNLKEVFFHRFSQEIGSNDTHFSHWTKEYQTKVYSQNAFSKDIKLMMESLCNNGFDLSEITEMISGSYSYFMSTMNDIRIKDKFAGYVDLCKLLGVKPKKTQEELLSSLQAKESKWEETFEKHLEVVKQRVTKTIESEPVIDSIDHSFEINATDYEKRYPGCFTNDLSQTKTNFSIPWCPSSEMNFQGSDFNNEVINSFREDLKTRSRFMLHRPYVSGPIDINTAESVNDLVLACLFDLSFDTTLMENESFEDVIDLETGAIKVDRTSSSKQWTEKDGKLSRNKNEFSSSKAPSNVKQAFNKGLKTLGVNFSKSKKISKINQIKEKVKEGEYDVSQQIYTTDNLGKYTHNKKLIKFNNQEAISWTDSITSSMFALMCMDGRETTKVKKVFDHYCDSPDELYLYPDLVKNEIDLSQKLHTLANKTGIYSYCDDMMQIAKGLKIADRFMSSSDFKIQTTSNTNMLCLAFKGDGMNTGTAGVPYIIVCRTDELLHPDFVKCYTKEVLGYYKTNSGYIHLMKPQRLNQVRLLSLFKAPSKVPILFNQYSLKSREIKDWLISIETENMNIFTAPGSVKMAIKNVCFSSIIIGTVTKLSRMGIFDFMRYAGFLPLSDYSKIKKYISEKFDPDITNVVDMYFVAGIRDLLIKMEDLNLSRKAVPITIDHENDMSGGIEELNIKCPVTKTTLKTLEDLYNNVYLAIYMMPKSLHTHVHNLTNLLNVSAEYEMKFREKQKLDVDSEVFPNEMMFNDSGKFSINGTLNISSLLSYYKENIRNVAVMRSSVESKEGFLNLPYKIATLKSSKKCSRSSIISEKDIVETLHGISVKDLESLEGKKLYLMKGLCKSYVEDQASCIMYLKRILDEPSRVLDLVHRCSQSDLSLKYRTSFQKFHQTSHPLTVEVYLKSRFSEQPMTVLKSKKVSEELYDLIKEYNKINEINIDELDKLGRGTNSSKASFMNILEYSITKIINDSLDQEFLVSVFEKMQRTKVDREIYLMGMKTKMMLYFIEHTYKHIAQNDPNEAISISGDYKIRTLASLSLDTITSYKTVLMDDINSKVAFLSSDQSKWSASDLTYKYIIAVMMNPVLTTGEANLMVECLSLYIKLKRVCIPTDIFLNLRRSQDQYCLNTTPIGILTKGLSTNSYPVTMNWLQGNLNYLSSVYHSCAMLGYKKMLSKIPNVKFQTRWMVHSDDNATSLVASGDVKKLMSSFKCESFPQFLFETVAAHFTSYSITLNDKKSYCSESEVEFISERIVNGAVIPLYCRHLANLCTESSHLSYFDDLMSLSTHLTMLLRKGCPNELIPASYAAVQMQSAGIYSMLPGEINDIKRLCERVSFPLSGKEVPTCMGGWLSLKVEYMASLGPSANDEMIYYNIMKSSLGSADFKSFHADIIEGRKLDEYAFELKNKIEKKTLNLLDEKVICLCNIFNSCLQTEDVDSLEVGMKFQSMVGQIIKLPQYVNENAISSYSSYKDFCKMYPGLRKNEMLMKSTKKIPEDDGLEDLTNEEMARLDLGHLMSDMINRPESFLISPICDRDFLLSQIFIYSSISKRNQLSTQATEKLALDRILRSKAKSFVSPVDKQKKTYAEILMEKMQLATASTFDVNRSLKFLGDILSKDLNFSIIESIASKLTPTNSTPKSNFNFRFCITEKLPQIIEGSPELLVINHFYGSDYIESLGLKNMPLTSDSMDLMVTTYGKADMIEDVARYIKDRDNSVYFNTEEFRNRDDVSLKLLCVNSMTVCQNKLMKLSGCLNRKSFPFYAKFNLGKTFVSNILSLISTIYSRENTIYFYANMTLNIHRGDRLLLNMERDLSLEKIIDLMVYISDKIQAMFPKITLDQMREVMKNLTHNGFLLDDRLTTHLSKINKDLATFKTRNNTRLAFHTQLISMSKHAPWLFNMGYITQPVFEFVLESTRNYEVTYIKSENQDSKGNYITDSLYRTAMKTESCYAQLAMSGSRVDVSLNAPYDYYNDQGGVFNHYKVVVEKLLSKLIVDKTETLKSLYSYSTMLKTGQACICVSSRGKLYAKFNNTQRNLAVSDVKVIVQVMFHEMTHTTWELQKIQTSYRLRKPMTGECFSNVYKELDSNESINEMLLNNFKIGLPQMAELKDLSRTIYEIEDEDIRDSLMTYLEELEEACLEGMRTCSTVDEYEEYLDMNGLNELNEIYLSIAKGYSQETASTVENVHTFYQRFSYELGSFKGACSALKYNLTNDSRGIRIGKPTGHGMNGLGCVKPIISENYDVLELLKLVKACETCHNNDSVLNLKIFKNIQNRQFYTRQTKLDLRLEMDLKNDVMLNSYDYKTLVLGEIELDEKAVKMLSEDGFNIAGEVLKVKEGDEETIKDQTDIDNLDESAMYEEIVRKTTIVKKKPGHLIPSNTLLMGEFIKFIMKSIKGNTYDLMDLLRRGFDAKESDLDRVTIIRKNISSLTTAGRILKEMKKEENPLEEIAECFESFLKIAKGRTAERENFTNVRKLFNAIKSLDSKSDKIKALTNLIDYLNLNPVCLTEGCLYGVYTAENLQSYLSKAKEFIMQMIHDLSGTYDPNPENELRTIIESKEKGKVTSDNTGPDNILPSSSNQKNFNETGEVNSGKTIMTEEESETEDENVELDLSSEFHSVRWTKGINLNPKKSKKKKKGKGKSKHK
ncbi:L protein [Bean necrotic mosaic virus]|uniref:RNA-directed RNA polymerase L n=1 Tax=Bean necrotic mosaic virus TaxID=1033976 RepID=F8TVS1_9VIRU|nr:L protein [Bean necrotic mosaic virus]AEF56575.1 L protein [Bean necrotic mosaic virus]